MRLERDDRAIGFQLIQVALFVVVASMIIAMLVGPMDLLHDVSHDMSTGTEYEEDSKTMTDRVWTAFVSLPLVGGLLALVFVLAMAVLRSTPG